MDKYINYFLNYLRTKNDASFSTIRNYIAELNKLFGYLKISDIDNINQNHP